MNGSTKETLARVDALLARYDEAEARRNAQGATEGVKGHAQAAKASGLAATRRDRGESIIAKLDREAEERRKNFKAPEWVPGPSFLNIQCGKCGHRDDAGRFLTDSFGQDRPMSEMQCPKCHYASRRECQGGRTVLTPIQPTL